MYGNILEGLVRMIIIFIIIIGLIIGIISYLMGRNTSTTIESKKRIVPTWKLVTDGKKVDTIFIYETKNKK